MMKTKPEPTAAEIAEMQQKVAMARSICEDINKNQQGDVPALVKRLKDAHKLKFSKAAGGLIKADMLTLKGAPAATERQALINWSNAMRRELNKATA